MFYENKLLGKLVLYMKHISNAVLNKQQCFFAFVEAFSISPSRIAFVVFAQACKSLLCPMDNDDVRKRFAFLTFNL